MFLNVPRDGSQQQEKAQDKERIDEGGDQAEKQVAGDGAVEQLEQPKNGTSRNVTPGRWKE